MDTTFAQIIEDHLELKRKNAMLDPAMPLDRYRVNDFSRTTLSSDRGAGPDRARSGSDPDLDPERVLYWPRRRGERARRRGSRPRGHPLGPLAGLRLG